MNIKFPFCFFETQAKAENNCVLLKGVRFRYQFHPDMNTNISYPVVFINYSTGGMVVWADDKRICFHCKLELHYVPEIPK